MRKKRTFDTFGLRKTVKVLGAIVVVSTFSMACVNDKFDLSDIDSTVAFGSEELQLPSSSTQEVVLDDLLDLDDSETVVTDSNGYYQIKKDGGEIDPVHASVARSRISQESTLAVPVRIDLGSLPASFDLIPTGTELPGTGGTIEQEIQVFNFKGEHPEEVKALTMTEMEGTVSLKVMFNADLQSYLTHFTDMSLEFPPYMDINIDSSTPACIQEGHSLKFSNVATAQGIEVKGSIRHLDFTKGDEQNQLTFDAKNVTMTGYVKVKATYPDAVKGEGDTGNLLINSEMAISDLVLTGATGRFGPEIKLDELGSVTLTDIPDFLTEDDVLVDLYNPLITINLNSDMPVPGFLSGTLIATDKNGQELSRVAIPEMKVNAAWQNNGQSRILICRTNEGIVTRSPSNYTDVVVVPTLGDIIRRVPYTIAFESTARADENTECTIELGHEYTLQTAYNIEAPLAFAEDACIVYHKDMDGWQDDLEDYDLERDVFLKVMANIESTIPAYLTLSAVPIDKDGKSIDKLKVDIDQTVKASPDGKQIVTTPITITVNQGEKGLLKKVDGLKFTIKAAASHGGSSVTGITLNAKDHYIKARDIRMSLMGKAIINK